MKGCVVSPLARQDIIEITERVAGDSATVALRLADTLFAAFELLGEQPELGQVRDDLAAPGTGMKFWLVTRYLVAYRSLGRTVQIARVFGRPRLVARLPDAADERADVER